VELVKVPPHVGPAESQADRGVGAIAGQPLEPGIAIDLQHAAECRQMRGGPDTFAILGVDIGRHRVTWAAPWPVIDRIAPEPPGLGTAAAGVEGWQCGVVGKQLGRGQCCADQQVIERGQPPAGPANPSDVYVRPERRAVEGDALPRQHLALAVQRQAVAELAHQHRFCCIFCGLAGSRPSYGMAKRRLVEVRADLSFKGRQFTAEVILWAVRWYLMFPISYRDLELMLQDRGVNVAHTTIFRWIQTYASELEKRIRPHLRPSNGSWQVDET
jgi:hypothetical protein